MSYDKKSGTITIESDDPKDFERDLVAHMAHVTTQVDMEVARRRQESAALGKNKPSAARAALKWLAIALNLYLLGLVSYTFFTRGAPGNDEELLVALVFGVPIASLLAIALPSSESWISLYFRRKALEEKAKIRALEHGPK